MRPKITVNGAEYDDVGAMPEDVRRLYEQAMAQMPALSDRDGDGLPDVVKGDGLPPRTAVRRTFVVNGVTYEDENAMPEDVRRTYELAMRAASAGGLTEKKGRIQFSFQVMGPGFKLGTDTRPPSSSPRVSGAAASQDPSVGGMPAPIEPSSSAAGVRIAIVLAGSVAIGLALWLWMRAH
jgi:hypothetical protein